MCTISNSAGFCLSTVCCHGLQAELFGLNCTRISQESSYLASCVYFSSFGCWESAISPYKPCVARTSSTTHGVPLAGARSPRTLERTEPRTIIQWFSWLLFFR